MALGHLQQPRAVGEANSGWKEVELEHHNCLPSWTLVINRFGRELGGIMINAAPSTAGLYRSKLCGLERYKVCDGWANAMGINKSHKLLEMRMSHHVPTANKKGMHTLFEKLTIGGCGIVQHFEVDGKHAKFD